MKKINTEIKWALIFFAMSLVWMLLEKLSGLHDVYIDKYAVLSNLIAIPAIAIYFLALLEKKQRDYAGYMTYKQGFISGLILTVFITFLSPVIQVITAKFITPDFFANAIIYAETQGKYTPSEAEANFSLGSYILQGLIMTPLMGISTTIIVAFFTRSWRKKNHKPAEQTVNPDSDVSLN